jgi:hypothetical protein
MPSLLRFLFVLGVLGALAAGGLYVLAAYFEPQPAEIRQPVHDVKIRK